MSNINFEEDKYGVRRSVNPTNRVKHGIRQVLFPYDLSMSIELIKFSVFPFFQNEDVFQ